MFVRQEREHKIQDNLELYSENIQSLVVQCRFLSLFSKLFCLVEQTPLTPSNAHLISLHFISDQIVLAREEN